MSNLDLLPAAQLASLRLIVSGRSYSEVADALSIDAESVADNARLAVSTLAGSAAEPLAQAERGRIADWLLGQVESEPLVEGSPSARAFASAASGELASLEGARLPALPEPLALTAEPDGPRTRPTKSFARPGTGKTTSESSAAKPEASDTDESESAQDGGQTPEISRRGGIAVLGAAAAALLIGGLALGGVFDGGDEASTPTSVASTTPTTTAPSGAAATPDGKGGWTLRKRFTLKPVAGGKALGVAGLESKGTQNAMLVAGTGLPPNTTVGIWLTGSAAPALVGFQKVSSKGQFTAVAPVPKSAPQANRVIVTSESVKPGQPVPKVPGAAILASPFSI